MPLRDVGLGAAQPSAGFPHVHAPGVVILDDQSIALAEAVDLHPDGLSVERWLFGFDGERLVFRQPIASVGLAPMLDGLKPKAQEPASLFVVHLPP